MIVSLSIQMTQFPLNRYSNEMCSYALSVCYCSYYKYTNQKECLNQVNVPGICISFEIFHFLLQIQRVSCRHWRSSITLQL